jgi:predicted DNA-binding protein (MmcQ/YjbR family)
MAAMKLPETAEGASCNNSAFKARGKAFLYLGERDDETFKVMVKLSDSRAEAEKMAKADPDAVGVGPHWITAYFEQKKKLPAGLAERWVEESFRAVAPKKLIAEYDG